MSRNKLNRNQLERDLSDDSEAIEDNEIIVEDQNLPPVDEDSGEDLQNNIDRDYKSLQELDRYERESADDESYSSIDEIQRRLAEEELDEQENAILKNKKERFGQRLLEGLSDESEDQYAQRIEQRMQRLYHYKEEDENDNFQGINKDNVEEEKFEEEKFLDKESAKGKLHEWIQEQRTIRFIKFRFRNFLKNFKKQKDNFPYYDNEITKMCENNKQNLEIDYKDLAEKENMNVLLVWVLFEPKLIIPIFNEVLKEQVLIKYPDHDNISSEFYVQIKEINYTDKLRELRHRNIGHLLQIKGVITKRSAIFNQLVEKFYLCNKCGNRHGPIIDSGLKNKNLGNCTSCQSNGPFTLDTLRTLYRNYQKVTLQETPGSVPAGRVPTQKEVILLGSNIDACKPGDEVVLTGIYTYKFDYVLNLKHGFPLFSTCIEAIYIKSQADIETVNIGAQDIKEIEKLSMKPNICDILINSIGTSIYGHQDIKTAIALSLFGGVAKEIQRKHRTRGDINVLIVGDPGVAKSQFLKSVQKSFQKTVFTTGKGATAVGLTASVKRDLDTKEWTLEGGALVLADQGICLIDEFDKMNDYDRTSIHEAMEQQTISISKAGIVANLQARCSVIAAANPKTGRYNSSLNFMDNVDLTDPIVSRFDVLCVVKDDVNPTNDQKLASFVINSHILSHPIYQQISKAYQEKETMQSSQEPEMMEEQSQNAYEQYKTQLQNQLNDILLPNQKANQESINGDLLKKYIIYARKIKPKITQLDTDKIKNFYVELRQQSLQLGGIAVGVRHIESIIRMAESFAKMRLSNEVSGQDVDLAISVMLKSFISSQKYVVANSLKSNFKKYLIDSKDNFSLLKKIISDLLISRKKTLMKDTDKLQIPINLFQQNAKLYNINNISQFLESEDFNDTFKRVGDTIQLRAEF